MRLEGKSAIVTGAGRGLCQQYVSSRLSTCATLAGEKPASPLGTLDAQGSLLQCGQVRNKYVARDIRPHRETGKGIVAFPKVRRSEHYPNEIR
jgi:hypothetical protein